MAHKDTSIEGKCVFVTGATGFIGTHLCRRLRSSGADVIALAYDAEPDLHRAIENLAATAPGVRIRVGDVTDTALMSDLVSQSDIIVHAAAKIRGWRNAEFQHTNVDATQHLAAEAAKVAIERFIFISSISVYGALGEGNVDETSPLPDIRHPYGRTKISAERAVSQIADNTNLRYVIARPGMVYGPGSPGWTLQPLRLAQQGLIPLVNNGVGTCFPVFISDLVDGLILCATHPRAVGETFNFVGDGNTTCLEFFGGYQRMVGTNKALRLPSWLVKVFALPFYILPLNFNLPMVVSVLVGQGQVSNNKAKALLGWRPQTSLSEGLSQSEMWLRAEGYL